MISLAVGYHGDLFGGAIAVPNQSTRRELFGLSHDNFGSTISILANDRHDHQEIKHHSSALFFVYSNFRGSNVHLFSFLGFLIDNWLGVSFSIFSSLFIDSMLTSLEFQNSCNCCHFESIRSTSTCMCGFYSNVQTYVYEFYLLIAVFNAI